MGLKSFVAGLAVAAMSVVGAHASTVTAVSGTSGFDTFTAADTTASASAAFNGAASIFLQAIEEDTNGLTATLAFSNTLADALDLVATVNRLSLADSTGFIDPRVRVTSADGSVVHFDSNAPVGPAAAEFTIGAFEDFNVVLSYTGLNELINGAGAKAIQNFDVTINAIPLPAGLALLLTALGGLALVGRRRSMAVAA